MSKSNSFEIAQRQLDDCAKILKLDHGVHEFLRHPQREFHVSIPVRMDDGSIRIFQGFRVQYNDALGPCKGGIRYHPDETIDTVRALAAWMTWKTSLLGLPPVSYTHLDVYKRQVCGRMGIFRRCRDIPVVYKALRVLMLQMC